MSAILFLSILFLLDARFWKLFVYELRPLKTLALSNTEYAKIYNLLNEADCFILNIWKIQIYVWQQDEKRVGWEEGGGDGVYLYM